MSLASGPEQEFHEQFPNGYDIMDPNKQGAQCGLCALCDSIRAQVTLPPSQVPSVRLLRAIFRRQAQEIQGFEMDNDDNLRLDQLALVLQEFLKTRHICARLGVVYVPDIGKGKKYGAHGTFYQGRKRGYLILDNDMTGAGSVTVWIHSDNRRASEWANSTWRGIKPAT